MIIFLFKQTNKIIERSCAENRFRSESGCKELGLLTVSVSGRWWPGPTWSQESNGRRGHRILEAELIVVANWM